MFSIFTSFEHGLILRIEDLNLPICGLAAILVTLFLRLKTPPEPWYTKLRRMDWM